MMEKPLTKNDKTPLSLFQSNYLASLNVVQIQA